MALSSSTPKKPPRLSLAKAWLLVGFLVLSCTQATTPPQPRDRGEELPALSSAKDILALSFLSERNPGLPAGNYPGEARPGEAGADVWAIPGLPWNADLSCLVASFELSPGAQLFREGNFQVSGETVNDFSSPLSFQLEAEDGSTRAILIRAERLPEPSLSFLEASIEPSLVGRASAGRTIRITARLGGQGGCEAARAWADLSSVGLGPGLALEEAGGGDWTLAARLPGDLAPGTYTLPLGAEDASLGILASGAAILRVVAPAFQGGDMEGPGPAGLPAGASLSATEAFEGQASLHYQASPGANSLVALTSARLEPPSGATKLAFRFKGRTGGTAPGLRLQLGAGASNRCYYDLNALVSGQTLVVQASPGGTYPTAPIEAGEWTAVELDLSALKTSPDPADSLSNYVLQFRVRAGGVHDWYLDFIHFE